MSFKLHNTLPVTSDLFNLLGYVSILNTTAPSGSSSIINVGNSSGSNSEFINVIQISGGTGLFGLVNSDTGIFNNISCNNLELVNDNYSTTINAGSQSTGLSLTLPTAAATGYQYLANDGGGNLFWSSGIFYAEESLDASVITQMYSSPYEITSFESGQLIVIHKLFVYAYPSVAFANGGNIVMQYGPQAEGGGIAIGTISSAAFTTTTPNYNLVNVNSLSAITTNITTTGIYFSNTGAAFTSGPSSSTAVMDLGIWYQIIPQ